MKLIDITNNKVIKIFIKIIYVFFLILLSFIVFFNIGIFLDNYFNAYISESYAFAKNALIAEGKLSALMVAIFIFSLFANKKIMLVIWFLAFLKLPSIFANFPEMIKLQNINICDDIGYCVEGTRDWVSKEDCENEGRAWNVDDKACQYRFELKDCYKLEGNWQYPKACEEKILP